MRKRSKKERKKEGWKEGKKRERKRERKRKGKSSVILLASIFTPLPSCSSSLPPCTLQFSHSLSLSSHFSRAAKEARTIIFLLFLSAPYSFARRFRKRFTLHTFRTISRKTRVLPSLSSSTVKNIAISPRNPSFRIRIFQVYAFLSSPSSSFVPSPGKYSYSRHELTAYCWTQGTGAYIYAGPPCP